MTGKRARRRPPAEKRRRFETTTPFERQAMIGMVIFGSLLILASPIVLAVEFSEGHTMSATTEGWISKAQATGRSNANCNLDYRYEVDGHEFVKLDEHYLGCHGVTADSWVTVYYDPQNPVHSSVSDPGSRNAQFSTAFGVMLFGCIFNGVAVIPAIGELRARKRADVAAE
jgi:hypothetical protein